MRSIVSRSRPKFASASLLRVVRLMAVVLIIVQELRLQSRMLAYQDTGLLVGASPHWMRRFVRGDGDASLSFPVGLNIIAWYGALCQRVETSNYRTAQRLAELQREIHAAYPRALAEIFSVAAGAQGHPRLSTFVPPPPGREVGPAEG